MGKLCQVRTAVSCSMTVFLAGSLAAWPSYSLKYLTIENSSIVHEPMSELESAWVGSVGYASAIVGTLAIGVILDNIGRRNSGIFIALCVLVGWVVILVAKSSSLIIFGRFLLGAPAGSTLLYGPLFTSEVSDDSIRGTLSSLPIAFYSLGLMTSYIIGWIMSYYPIIYFNITLCVLTAALMMSTVESPNYLVQKNRLKDAANAIAKYRSEPPSSKFVLEEITRLKRQINSDYEMVPLGDVNTQNIESQKEAKSPKSILQKFRVLVASPAARRALFVIATNLILQVFLGMMPVQVFSSELFLRAAPNLSSDMCSVLFSVVYMTGSLTSTALSDRLGRRFLIIITNTVIAITMIVLGCLNQTDTGPAWLAVLLILVYGFMYNAGPGNVPYVLLVECFVSEVQTLVSTMLIVVVWMINFGFIMVFVIVTKHFGIAVSFYVFGIAGLISAIFSYFTVPETKGLSIEEIQHKLEKRII